MRELNSYFSSSAQACSFSSTTTIAARSSAKTRPPRAHSRTARLPIPLLQTSMITCTNCSCFFFFKQNKGLQKCYVFRWFIIGSLKYCRFYTEPFPQTEILIGRWEVIDLLVKIWKLKGVRLKDPFGASVKSPLELRLLYGESQMTLNLSF